jgi:hypothetical protein
MPSRPRPLGVESLESRHLCAGNVQVRVVHGSVTFTGDNAANVFTLTQVGTNRYVATGAAHTTLNHKAALRFSFSKDAAISLAGGADRLTIGSSKADTKFAGTLNINTGAGADVVNVVRVQGSGGTTVLGTAKENDVDTLNVVRSKFAGTVSLQTGGGNDSLKLSRSRSTGTLRIDTGAGSDHATLDNVSANNIFLQCGAGNDTAVVSGHNTLSGNVTADGGAGKDTATLASNATFNINLFKTFNIKNIEDNGLNPF